MSKEKTIIYLEPELKQELQITAIKLKTSMTGLVEEFIITGLEAKKKSA